MIKSFRSKDAALIFNRLHAPKLSLDIQRIALRKMLLIDAAEQIEDLRIPPGNRLEKLSGDRQGQYSIRLNDQWRICFRWYKGDAYDVEIVEYH